MFQVTFGVLLLNLVCTTNSTKHRYYSTNYPVHGYKVGHKYPDRFKQYHGYEYLPRSTHEHNPKISQNARSKSQLGSVTPKNYHVNSEENSGLFHYKPRNKLPTQRQTHTEQQTSNKSKYVNFVTPKVEQFPRNTYEVTTEKLKEDEEQYPPLTGDNDLTIAIDDEEEDTEKLKVLPVGGQHPEHQNPLVYKDSYGKVHETGEARDKGQGFQYGVVHQQTPSATASHYHYTHYKKPTGRVRMQVLYL